MPTQKRSTSRSRSGRSRGRRGLFGERGVIRLLKPVSRLNLRSPKALLAIGLVAVIGAVAVTYSMASTVSYSLWSNSAKPAVVNGTDARAAELGVRFKATQNGFITGIRFYKAKANTGTHDGSLWTTDGTRLGKATFANETSSGWQKVTFATPVPIEANRFYIASYHTTVGRYSYSAGYFKAGRSRGPLVAPAGTATEPNGVYHLGDSAFPDVDGGNNNYWVDVMFTPNAPASPSATPTPTPTPTPSDTPSPTPTPTASPSSNLTGCQSSPSRCGYPDATTTGYDGVPLTVVSGDMTIDTANTVVSGKDIRGCVNVEAPGVIIKNSKITCNGFYGIQTSLAAAAVGATRLTIQDVEMVLGGNTTGIGSENITATRVYIHGGENGFDLSRDVTVSDSYITGIVEINGGHGDGIQFSTWGSGQAPKNILIDHNSIIVADVTSAANWTDDTTSITIQNNLLAGGGYTLYCPRVSVPSGAFKTLNNRFGTFIHDHSDSCNGSGQVWTGNYLDSNLATLAP